MSEGIPTLRRALEDADACYDYLRGELSGPLGVMGRSLGSQCAAQLAPRSDLAYLVWESGFLDLKALVVRRGMPVPPSFSEDELAVFNPAPKLNAGRAPLLVIHAEEDQVIHPAEAHHAFEGYPCSRKTLALIPHRGHNDISTSPHYWQTMSKFLFECC
jgi:dienelactone hydrolase